MVFSSPRFILFLVAVLVVLSLLRGVGAKKHFLAVASSVFYAAWDWRYLGLLLGISVIDYWAADRISSTDRPGARKAWLLVSVVSNLGTLAYFKYCNFFIENVNALLGPLGVSLPVLNILLPAGISFYTFKTMSYTIDVYRRELAPCRSWLDYATFVTFFPELIAGPIVRASIFLPQMGRDVGPTRKRLSVGVTIFLQGLFKKLVLADRLASVADPVFADPAMHSPAAVWFGLLAYSLQIYCDFSAYSDMAIGTAKMIGYDLPENFNMPYLATNITDFWRRWHMTLSSWLRDYLYIPLGGNRHGTARTYVNLTATMLLGGLWHGASWNFVLWGGLHGAGLAFHKWLVSHRRGQRALPTWAGRVVTLLFVVVAWVPFRSTSWASTRMIFARLVGLDAGGFAWWPFWLFACGLVVAAGHVFGAIVLERWRQAGGLPAHPGLLARLGFGLSDQGVSGPYLLATRSGVSSAFVLAFLVIVLLLFGETKTNPFIYFQF